ncbi:MAG TPA: ABC transporter ATP-binding protein [Candidatus Paceibacterota bacterium]|nr:ABC transporter ATP-binding protein [Candidatus Paceibacterota bacterium]
MSKKRLRGEIKDINLQSLKNLWRANVFVIKEVWQNHTKEFYFLTLFAILVALSPYLQRGVEALLINHLASDFGNIIIDQKLLLLILLFPTILLFNSTVSALADYWDMMGWRSMRTRFEMIFSEKMASLDVAKHEDPKFRDKVQLVDENGSSFMISNFFGKFVRNITNVVGFITAAIIMLQANWLIFVIVVVVTIPRFIVELKYGEEIWTIYQTSSENKRHLWHAKEQVSEVQGIRELQIYGTTNFFIGKIKNILDDFHTAHLSKDKKILWYKILTQALVSISFGIIVWFLIQPVIAGQMQIGTFVFILAASLGLQQSVIGFFLALSSQYQDAQSVNTFVELMNEKPLITNPETAKKINLEKAPEIIFENVSFSYPSKPDEFVLKDFNLKIESGEKLAIVGTNGAGKSTFIKLLCRFYDPTSGRILINGIDLKELDLNCWYKHLALLSQDYKTYKLPVKELIHLGKIESNMNQQNISNASVRANADEFIQKWKMNYNQQIGVEFTNGVDPSQGQKQKLSLARALFRNAFVTILDEPTASIDAKAEKEIFDQLEKNTDKTKTLILISHRFATVRNADKIAVISGQNIKEYGTHRELVEINGIYNQMYSSQAAGYRD